VQENPHKFRLLLALPLIVQRKNNSTHGKHLLTSFWQNLIRRKREKLQKRKQTHRESANEFVIYQITKLNIAVQSFFMVHSSGLVKGYYSFKQSDWLPTQAI